MNVTAIQAKSILIRRPKVDSWFLAGYGMNLYRGCTHCCVYCDGQSESYRVEGVFGQDVGVKTNAIDLLRKELDPSRQRKPLDKGFILLGGGVGDSYQPLENETMLTRRVLELIARFRHPVHILTKSTLVLRDLDLLKKVNDQARVVVSFSFSGVEDKLCALFEPGVPPPSERLNAILKLKKEGLTCGMFLMPVIPCITDTDPQIGAALAQARKAGVDFVVFSSMTLKQGRQKDHFLKTLRAHYPQLTNDYVKLYAGDCWGMPDVNYDQALNARFFTLSRQFSIPVRMPVALCKPFLSESNLVSVILAQMDYLLKLRGQNSSLGYIAHQINQLRVPFNQFSGFSRLKGMRPEIEALIKEILETGDCRLYQELLV